MLSLSENTLNVLKFLAENEYLRFDGYSIHLALNISKEETLEVIQELDEKEMICITFFSLESKETELFHEWTILISAKDILCSFNPKIAAHFEESEDSLTLKEKADIEMEEALKILSECLS